MQWNSKYAARSAGKHQYYQHNYNMIKYTFIKYYNNKNKISQKHVRRRLCKRTGFYRTETNSYFLTEMIDHWLQYMAGLI